MDTLYAAWNLKCIHWNSIQISYLYLDRWVFYLELKTHELLDIRACARFGTQMIILGSIWDYLRWAFCDCYRSAFFCTYLPLPYIYNIHRMCFFLILLLDSPSMFLHFYWSNNFQFTHYSLHGYMYFSANNLPLHTNHRHTQKFLVQKGSSRMPFLIRNSRQQGSFKYLRCSQLTNLVIK